MNPKIFAQVMALASKLKGVSAAPVAGPEMPAAAVKVGEFGAAGRGVLVSGTVDGEAFHLLAVGGEKSASLLSGLLG